MAVRVALLGPLEIRTRSMVNSRRKARHLLPAARHDAPASKWVRLAAWLLCGVTFPLLWIGGLVTTTKSGMSVPDWPGTYGYNLFLYPWSSWFFGPWDLFIEHGHRLLASLAGLVTILLMILLFRCEPRRWMQIIGVVALFGVIAQGVLGGLRVVLDERLLAMVHGSTGPLFFALTVAIVVWTSRIWITASPVDEPRLTDRLAPMAAVACVILFVQMILGAALRHMPVTAAPQTFMTAVKLHLFFAGIVALLSLALGWQATRPQLPACLRRAGLAMVAIVAVQLTLGVVAWLAKYGVPAWAIPLVGTTDAATLADGWWQSHMVTAHQATGSLLLAATLVITLFAWRFSPVALSANQSVHPSTSPKPGVAV